MSSASKLGQRLAAARKGCGLSREDVASLRRCSFSTIRTYELGLIVPPLPVLAALAEIYGVRLVDLLDGVDIGADTAMLAGTA